MRYHASSVASLLRRTSCTSQKSRLRLLRTYASSTSQANAHNGPLHVVLLGAPGAGKGTQTDSLLRKYDLKAVVVGNLLRDEVSKKTALGTRAAEIMKAGGLLDDATILDVVRPALHKLSSADWILDGYPRTPQQAHDLNNALAEWNESINLVVQLDVPDEVLLSRIEARWVHVPSGRVYNTDYNPPKTAALDDVTGEPLTKRLDDNPEVFKKRLEKYHEKNEPIVDYYRKQGSLVTLSGKTSAEIWPKLDKVVQDRFPQLGLKT